MKRVGSRGHVISGSWAERSAGYSRYLPLALAAGAFVIDAVTPNGVLDGFTYIPAVLSCMWVSSSMAALWMAIVLMVPMTLGFLLSPTAVPMEFAVLNRSVAIATVWLIALAIFIHVRSSRERESALSRELQVALQSARIERSALSDWLHTQIDTELEVIAWRLNVLVRRQPGQGFDVSGEALLLQRAVQRTYACVREQEGRLRRAGGRVRPAPTG